jgi:putative effector of murein hydrolase LrgA (UPF0299 family)
MVCQWTGHQASRLQDLLEAVVMLEQISRVMFWLCVGEIAARSGLLPLPAPVTGLILLYADLAVRGKLPDDLGVLADRLLQFLGMLFVPAGVGVIAYLDVLKAEALPIFGGSDRRYSDYSFRNDGGCELARHRDCEGPGAETRPS